jgi:predicted nucleic acid-binding protein
MRYLLDVNALVALGFLEHQFHNRVTNWINDLISKGIPEVVSCSVTELGFIRVLAKAPQYNVSVEQARILLTRLKINKTLKLTFVVDDQEVSKLPAWVKTAKHTTDGHLVQVARAHGAVLATLDRKIPAALVIPPTPEESGAQPAQLA